MPASVSALVVLVLLLSGCAAPPLAPSAQTWVPGETWWNEASRAGGTLTARDGSLRHVAALHARNLREVSRQIQAESGIVAEIALVDDQSLNAFAGESGGERRIALTLRFLAAIGEDRDAIATTIGHEAAHLHYRHSATREQRGGPIIGDAVAIAGIIAVNTSFSRFEEREADIKGMDWAVAAGFSPCGAVRTMRLLEARGMRRDGEDFRATHPGYTERIARANALSRTLEGRRC